MNFYTLCAQNFRTSDEFLVTPTGLSYSYEDLSRQSAGVANYLRGQGLKPGDRVLVQVEKSPQALFWYFGCLRAGIIYIPLNTAYTPAEIEYFCSDAEPALIVCDPDWATNFPSDIKKLLLDSDGKADVQLPPEPEAEDFDAEDDAIAVILYTSGTTGKPKGAMISHGNLAANAESLSTAWQWQRNDIMLHALPIFHIHGLFVATHLSVLNGSKILYLPKFDPQLVVDHLPQATVYMGVPTNYIRLLKHEAFNQQTCENMRLFTSGSAPLLPQTFEEVCDRIGHTIVERYGMTETGMNTSNPLDGPRKPGTVGPALPGVAWKIVDDDSQPVDDGEPGMLCVKGPNVFKGYWRKSEKTAEEFDQDGFFRTGDIASVDTDGYISIIGRGKDLIITGGLNVYPREIESVIDDLEGVVESAVIGLPHDDFGEAVTAVIVPTDSCPAEDALIATLKTSLASFKVPKRILFVDALPRNTMGKVQKNQLRAQYQNLFTSPSSKNTSS